MTYRHIVLFRVKADADTAGVEAALELLRGLSALPGVLSWRVEPSLDTRKGTIIIEDATFADRLAYERFRAHPAHQEAASALARVADWWVGDYLLE